MKNIMKQKYVPCELNVVEFKVERGFAVSPANVFIGDPNQQATMMFWSMQSQHTDDKGISHYRNEQFIDDINWF